MRIAFSLEEIVGWSDMAEDLTKVDFFRDSRLTDDPYTFYEALREKCPVTKEEHYGVTMVTGWQEAVDVYNDAETFSSCISVTGPFPGFPVSLEGMEDGDVTALIEQHRDEIPFSDQLPTLDPPTHTNHRALLMRLITPKRLKENEDAMWQLADDILDDFLAPGEGEFIKGFAGPFTLRVIADLLGVPEEDRPELLERLARGTHGSGLGNADKTLTKTPLEYLYDVFATYVEDRRAEPRDDVLTGLATASFPDGSMPEVGDVVRVATNVFSAGQETTVRLLSTALKVLGDRRDIQQKLRADRSLLPNFIEECLRIESPVKGDFRLSRVPTTVGDQPLGAGCTLMVINGAANRDPRRFEDPDDFDPERKNARQHLAFGRGIHSCPGAPLARAETRVGLERLLDRTADIRISETHHGPAEKRNYQYIPTYILRGLTELHLEFDLA
ncbi:cytochrome P450 [Mycobacterium sp. PO1]|nr:cytochrome P450 [Mycobacterium sp. PO1]GFM25248.1 cytochrome P450 [Mycobacterium sp. PO2]